MSEGSALSQESLNPPTKIEELESIRGLAALLIVFFHFPKWNPWVDVGLVRNGDLMVDLFFVLSGFVIFNAYAERVHSFKALLRFQFLRVGRLYPVHLLFLLLFFGIEFAKYVAVTRYGVQDVGVAPFKENTFSAFVEHFFLVQAIGPTGNVLTFNSPSWSISVELYTYLIFGISVLCFQKTKIFCFGFLSATSLVLFATGYTGGFDALLRCIAGFFLGCLTAKWVQTSKQTLPSYVSLFVFGSIVAFLQLKEPNSCDILVYFLTAALIVSLRLAPSGAFHRILRLRILTWLGAISYSIYMSHSFVFYVLGNVLNHLLAAAQSAERQEAVVFSTSEKLLVMLVMLVAVLACSQAVYVLIEKPLRERSRRFALTKFGS